MSCKLELCLCSELERCSTNGAIPSVWQQDICYLGDMGVKLGKPRAWARGRDLTLVFPEEFLHPLEEAIRLGRGRAVRLALVLELLEQFLLLLAEVDRGLDHDLGIHVAARIGAQDAHALAL